MDYLSVVSYGSCAEPTTSKSERAGLFASYGLLEWVQGSGYPSWQNRVIGRWITRLALHKLDYRETLHQIKDHDTDGFESVKGV